MVRGRAAREWAGTTPLRRQWQQDRIGTEPAPGSFRFAAPERDMLYRHAARPAEAATERIRRSAGGDPSAAADAAWAAAATFEATARAIRDPALRRAADTYDRAARATYGKIPHRTIEGDRLRAAARLLAMMGGSEEDSAMPAAVTLVASLVRLAKAVSELRQAQQHAAQAAAARKTVEGLYAALSRSRAGAAALGKPGRQCPPCPAAARRARRSRFSDAPTSRPGTSRVSRRPDWLRNAH